MNTQSFGLHLDYVSPHTTEKIYQLDLPCSESELSAHVQNLERLDEVTCTCEITFLEDKPEITSQQAHDYNAFISTAHAEWILDGDLKQHLLGMYSVIHNTNEHAHQFSEIPPFRGYLDEYIYHTVNSLPFSFTECFKRSVEPLTKAELWAAFQSRYQFPGSITETDAINAWLKENIESSPEVLINLYADGTSAESFQELKNHLMYAHLKACYPDTKLTFSAFKSLPDNAQVAHKRSHKSAAEPERFISFAELKAQFSPHEQFVADKPSQSQVRDVTQNKSREISSQVVSEHEH